MKLGVAVVFGFLTRRGGIWALRQLKGGAGEKLRSAPGGGPRNGAPATSEVRPIG